MRPLPCACGKRAELCARLMENKAGKCVGDGVGGELSCLHTLNRQLCLQGATLHMGLLCWKASAATGAFVGRGRGVGLGCISIQLDWV